MGQTLARPLCHFQALRGTEVMLRPQPSWTTAAEAGEPVRMRFCTCHPCPHPEWGSDVSGRGGGKEAKAQLPAPNSGHVFGAFEIIHYATGAAHYWASVSTT